jgi:hypothetical protein
MLMLLLLTLRDERFKITKEIQAISDLRTNWLIEGRMRIEFLTYLPPFFIEQEYLI